MSSAGANIPYHFKPNKFVDRQIFFDLLERYGRYRPIENAGYVSMGAYTMVDHSQIYRRFGIRRLYSFDGEKSIVERARFNRPTLDCICKHEKTNAVAKNIASIRKQLSLTSNDPLIVWFDFTDPLNASTMLDVNLLLGSLSEGDIARFTFNAHPHSYIGDAAGKIAGLTRQKLWESRKKFLSQMYEDIKLDPTSLPEIGKIYEPKNISTLIVRTLEAAALDNFGQNPNLDFELLSAIHYKDGVDMVTITGAIVSGKNLKSLQTTMNLDNWAYKTPAKHQPFKLSLDQMTLREYLSLDRLAASNASIADVKKELGFDKIGKFDITNFYEEFKLVSRLYPSFLQVAT